MQFPEILRLIHNLVRLGTVAEVDLDAALCRVQIGELITTWRPWLSVRAGKTRVWDPPSIGEQVVVLSPGGDPAAAVVLCGLNSNQSPAPSNEAGVFLREFEDGTTIRYDVSTHELQADVNGKAMIIAQAIEVTGTTLIKGATTIQGNTTIQGDVAVHGSADFNGGSVQHNGKNIGETHKHLAVQTGSGVSGVPQ